MSRPVGAVETPARRICGAAALGARVMWKVRHTRGRYAHCVRTVTVPPPQPPLVGPARRSLVRVALR